MHHAKYKNIKTEIDGITFDSKAEARRYSELKILAQSGKIVDLHLQPDFNLHSRSPEGYKIKVCKYIADFYYKENEVEVVEDVKGVPTPVFKLKAKMFKIEYPQYDFRIVRIG